MDFFSAPIDSESAERLSRIGLRLGLVDTGDREQFGAWLQAESRGFHGATVSEESIDEQVEAIGYRRTTGVWDDAAYGHELEPVGTVSSWTAPLSVPGGSVQVCAISSVSVAPTHRRRGLARALLEAELRTAANAGIPLAALTVSEATIYSRYGFAPAAMAVDLEFDTRRAVWCGPTPAGRVQFVTLEQLREEGRQLVDRIASATPGELALDEHLWLSILGLTSASAEKRKSLRAVRYADREGALRGFVIYDTAQTEADFSAHTVSVRYLAAETDDAYAALWRYLLELDLVATVKAPLRRVDEPVLWQFADRRAVKSAWERDHLWLRILDVRAALEARRYCESGRFALEVSDPLGFAETRVLLTVAEDGTGTVTGIEDGPPDGIPALALGINELAALYLGGVRASTLQHAGRLQELTPGGAEAVDAAFRAPTAPWLSIWF